MPQIYKLWSICSIRIFNYVNYSAPFIILNSGQLTLGSNINADFTFSLLRRSSSAYIIITIPLANHFRRHSKAPQVSCSNAVDRILTGGYRIRIILLFGKPCESLSTELERPRHRAWVFLVMGLNLRLTLIICKY